MNVKELKEMLSKYDDNDTVYFDEFEDELCPMSIDAISENMDGSGITIKMVFI